MRDARADQVMNSVNLRVCHEHALQGRHLHYCSITSLCTIEQHAVENEDF